MSGLSPQSRAIVEAARHGDDPSPEDRVRIRRALALRVGAGLAAGAAASASASAAGASGVAAAGALGKAALAVAIVALGGAGYYVAMRPESPAPRPSAMAAQVQPTVLGSARAAPPPVTASAVATDAPPAASPAVVVSAPAAPAVSGPDLEREVARLREAHVALRDGKPAEAMNLLDEEQPDVLVEERAAMRVFALCRMGRREEARAEAALFLQRWPRSPQAGRVKAACAE
jgi:hypothetical protein